MLKPSQKGDNLYSREDRNSNLEKLNALNSRMPEELADAYCRLYRDDETRVIVVTGDGEHSAPERTNDRTFRQWQLKGKEEYLRVSSAAVD